MPILDSAQFLKPSKNFKDFPSALLLIGDEENLVAESFHHFRSQFEVAYGKENLEFNVEVFHGDRDEPERIVESCMTLPFLSEKRLVVVHHIEKGSDLFQKKLTGYCSSPNPSTCLLLLWNAKPNQTTLAKELPSQIIQCGTIVKCWKLFEERKLPWVQEKCAKMGKQISPKAVEFLVKECGESLGELTSEIEKLVLYVGEKKEISLSDVQETMSFKRNRSIWDFIDHLEKGNIKKAGQILEHCLEQGEEPIKMLNMIARSVRNRVNRSNYINVPSLLVLFNQLKQYDLLLKSGHGLEAGIFENLLNSIQRELGR